MKGMKKTPGKLNSPKAAEPAGSRRKEFAAGKPFIEKETRIHPKTRAALIRAIKGPQLSNALLALEEMITYYDEKKAVVILGKIACDENVFLREVKIWAVEILYERYGDLDAMWKIWGDALDGKVQALASQKIALMDRKIPKTDEHPSITRIRRADITYLRKMSSDPSMLAMIAKNNQKLVYYALDILLGMKDKVGLLDVAVHSDSEKADGAAVQALRRLTWICTSADELAFFFVIYQSAKSKAARDEAKKIIDSEQQI